MFSFVPALPVGSVGVGESLAIPQRVSTPAAKTVAGGNAEKHLDGELYAIHQVNDITHCFY